jgi:ribosomal protein S18 acetylase RimI-like enzyme
MSVPSSSELLVRDAVASDAEGIAAIGQVAFPELHLDLLDQSLIELIVAETYSVAALVECIDRCAASRDAHFLVAERRGALAGYLHYDSDGAEPELHRIYLDPAQKRSGIGSALLGELHARIALGDSYILMVAAANDPAIAFYRRHGLEEEQRVDAVAFYREHMGVEFPPGTPELPALVLRYTHRTS